MTELADRIILARKNSLRVLSLFLLTGKLDNPDIVKVTALSNIRVSNALSDLALYGVLDEAITENKNFTKKSKKYYYLIEAEKERVTSISHYYMKQDQFKKDKAKIEELLAKGEIESFFK